MPRAMMKPVFSKPLITEETRYAGIFEPGGQRLAREIKKEDFYFKNLQKYKNVKWTAWLAYSHETTDEILQVITAGLARARTIIRE